MNGNVESYRITVQDNGEPNQGLDTFAIKTDSYERAGSVERGNVQGASAVGRPNRDLRGPPCLSPGVSSTMALG